MIQKSKAAIGAPMSVRITYTNNPISKYQQLAEEEMPNDAPYRITQHQLMMDDHNPRLNLASFVSTWMEPECSKLMLESMNKNIIDLGSTEIQDRCVNIIARLFNAQLGPRQHAMGVATVGSSEGCMLAGVAYKRKWQKKRKEEGNSSDNPNLVCGTNIQVHWERFCRYFEVEMKPVNVSEGQYVMDPHKAVEKVDENTICIIAIVGSTYNGQYEDVKLLNDLLEKKFCETKIYVPIHVDAASGGFVAPFLFPELEWDFRLPHVKSINVSGHKYGLVYPGIGWAIWQHKEDIPEELIFHVNYLGCDQPTITLNHTKGAQTIIAQSYQFLRLGYKGCKAMVKKCMEKAKYLQEGLMKSGRFINLAEDSGVPMVALSLKDKSKYDEYGLVHHLRRYGWAIPAYTMPLDAQHITLMRMVIRDDFSRSLADRLMKNVRHSLKYLDKYPPPKFGAQIQC